MTTFYTLNNKVYYVPVEAIPRLTDAMCEERVTRDGKSVYVIREGLPDYLREIFDILGEFTFKQAVAVIHNRSHPLLNLGDEVLRKIVVYAGPYRGFLHQTSQAFFKKVKPINNCLAMAGVGDLAMMKKLKPQKFRSEKICKAVLKGHSECEEARLDVLKWLVAEKKYDIKAMPFGLAVLNGDIKILEWARSCTAVFFKKSPLVNRMLAIAAQYGKVEVMEWARLNGADIKGFDCEASARNGHLSALKWAHNKKVKLSRGIFFRAAHYGHLHILKWGVHEKLFKLEKLHFSLAVSSSNLEILKWLKIIEAPIDWDFFYPDNIESLIWAAESGLEEQKVKSYLAQLGFRKEKMA